jgi:2-desacetyl-2-hydroxyethyl bacteriochlorophyllide A dehydrogenase
MRAAFCTGARSIDIREVPLPQATPDTLVVRVHACGICGSDLHYYYGTAPPPAVCLGHEICGRVTATGGGLSAGEAVVVEPLVACGSCPRCRAGEPNLCSKLRILGAVEAGGFADAVLVPTSSVYRLPAGLDLDTAMLAEPLAVAIHAARLATIAVGDEVLVLGGGTIGLLAAFAAARSGARVTVSARYPHQRAMALALGAVATTETGRDAVLDATAREPPDVVLESVGGTADTLDLALQAVQPGGRIVALGKFIRPITLHPLRFLMKEPRLVSSMMYSRSSPRPDFAIALALLSCERGLLARLITHRVALAQIANGFALAADKSSRAIKVAVTVATSD